LNLLMFAQLLLAGLDVGRLHWSATVPLPLQILGLIGFAMGMGLTTWAMLHRTLSGQAPSSTVSR
jgi:hypothetical protein